MPPPPPVPATTYTCPEGWEQVPSDSANGKCVCSCDTFYYGPSAGGYPLNRRPCGTRCVDLNNGSDQSRAWDNKVDIWNN